MVDAGSAGSLMAFRPTIPGPQRGGTDAESNMAMVCSRGPRACHPLLVPNGPYALIGDPGEPGGLRMVHLDELTDDDADRIGLPDELRNRAKRRGPPRAGPEAA